jgi:hypothetical protein
MNNNDYILGYKINEFHPFRIINHLNILFSKDKLAIIVYPSDRIKYWWLRCFFSSASIVVTALTEEFGHDLTLEGVHTYSNLHLNRACVIINIIPSIKCPRGFNVSLELP